MTLGQTWAVLLGLSLVSAALSGHVGGAPGGGVALAVLLGVAGLKAHLILKSYLGLGRCPPVLRGFDVVLAAVMIALLGLALAG